jgi:L-asparaginase
MTKKKIMVIKAGGTVCEKPNEKGFLEIPKEGQDYFHLIPEIKDLANISEIDIPPIDSTNMTLHHRKNFVDIIKNNYQNQDGFVIIQGTDTLAESAISMNYMIQNLGKPIIFTGAQKPIYVENTDAIENIKNSILVASENIGESAIVFDGKIIRGSRAVKRHSEDFFGFYSPKIKEIGKIENGQVNFNEQIPRKFYLKPEIFTNFKKNVLYYSQISGADTNYWKKL